MKTKIIFTCLIAFATLGNISCTKSSSNNNSNPNSVSIAMMLFTPSSLTVTAGTTVTWTNNDNITHTVTSTSGVFDSGNLAPGGTFSFKFTTKGTYPYKCLIHTNMTGTIIVN